MSTHNVSVIGIDGKAVRETKLPQQFSEEFRPDLIKRAVLTVQSNRIQPHGVKSSAGKRPSAKISRRRRDYKTGYGRGMSRTPRKIVVRRGLTFHYVGAFSPNTVGGRKAHPPKAQKQWTQKMNVKERRKAIRSAIAATMNPTLVKKRGHTAQSIIIHAQIEDLAKTKDVTNFLKTVGMATELARTEKKKVRAGKGKNRGRPYKKKKGLLFVVSSNCPLQHAAENLPGVDICQIRRLNVELLAPGTAAGRLTLWSEKAIEFMEKERLFY